MSVQGVDRMLQPGHGGDSPMIVCDQLLKVYNLPEQDVIALQGLQLTVGRGERVGIIGASGSGKSTLLNILGALVRPTAGTAVVDGVDLVTAGRRVTGRYRRSVVGLVWQQSSRNLVPYLSAGDNVALPLRAGRSLRGRRTIEARVSRLLALVDLSDRSDHLPPQLSGGEQQRVAIAVALANDPALLLADEPTGELDSATAQQIYRVLERITEETGLTQVIVSHDRKLANHVDRVVAVGDGRIVSERRVTRAAGDAGVSETSGLQEFVTVDRFGHLQLSKPHREALGIEHLVAVTIEDDGLRIRPAPIGDEPDESDEPQEDLA